ncbi:MAG TPA: hypothetical protein VGR00_09255 [Thermoanaerobaculia bacterium]|nr:hypothetical protein [Thermoanaerobaculia bacterium]
MSEPPLSFEEARERLRARGYLDRGVEGAVLKGALAARTRENAVFRAAALAALFLAVALALAETAFVAAASALGARDTAVLFLWLLAAAVAVAAAVALVLVGLARWRLRRAKEAEAATTELGLLFGVVVGGAAALAATPALGTAGPLAAAAVLVAVAILVFVAIRVARGVTETLAVTTGSGLLSGPRRTGTWVAVTTLAAIALAALFVGRKRSEKDGPLVVEANTRRVVVIAVDGWSDRYLAPAAVPPLGAAKLSYAKRESDPAAFWTTVATGEPSNVHGIGSLDLVRIAGLSSPVKPVAGTDVYLARLLPVLGLSRRESVTSSARRVPAAWEVARRAGIPSLVVNWWTTYPAGEDGGTVFSNHLFFAARAGRPLAGEGWPAEAVERAARLAPRVAPEPGTVDRLVEDARGLDDFAWRSFREELSREKPRLAMVYLPGLDILGAALNEAQRGAADRVALATALGEEARRLLALLQSKDFLGEADLVVTILDGGRCESRGDVFLAGSLVREGAKGSVEPVDIAPTLLAVLGVPASRETAGKPRLDLLARGGATTSTVASWGRRRAGSAPPVDPKEYVENLRSLGYLK